MMSFTKDNQIHPEILAVRKEASAIPTNSKLPIFRKKIDKPIALPRRRKPIELTFHSILSQREQIVVFTQLKTFEWMIHLCRRKDSENGKINL